MYPALHETTSRIATGSGISRRLFHRKVIRQDRRLHHPYPRPSWRKEENGPVRPRINASATHWIALWRLTGPQSRHRRCRSHPRARSRRTRGRDGGAEGPAQAGQPRPVPGGDPASARRARAGEDRPGAQRRRAIERAETTRRARGYPREDRSKRHLAHCDARRGRADYGGSKGHAPRPAHRRWCRAQPR